MKKRFTTEGTENTERKKKNLGFDILNNLRALRVLRGVIVFLPGFFSFAYSADRIAFVAPAATGWQLFTTNPDGTGTKQLTSGEYDVREPDWFVDRSAIVFTTTGGKCYLVNENPGIPFDTITSAEYYFWQAAVNKKGTEVYLIAGKPREADQTFIMKYNRATRKQTVFLSLRTPVYHLDLSPVNDDVLFANTLCGSDCAHVIQEIWLREATGNNAHQLHLLNTLSRYPRWCPDGKRFLFDSEINGMYRIFIQKIDGGTPEPIIGNPSRDDNYSHPVCSPDGKTLGFLKNGQLFTAPFGDIQKAVQIIPFSGKSETRIKDIAW